ncbi:hypothetical protein [Paenibacillus prosopidis]|uniref:Lipoprotein n=1 Tax=Paenibacillus prosopidis TaxID=630520 RepID=A0A368VQE0_9BACL|nr:hypothetical protein [Paenibacillus prosopidis]RCW42186.1 hypothetical protein DFP97_11815 [Paenibacillus prosopidis]
MKFRIIIFMLAIVAFITGCTNSEKEEDKFTVENVIQAIQAEGPKLISKGQADDAFSNLNNVKPNVFNISNPIESSKPESISVYIFDSEKARIEGLKIFNQHIETAKLVSYPIVYEQKNALVIYFSSREKNTKFGEKIQTAMRKL